MKKNISELLEMSYEQVIAYLINKYGPAEHNYFKTESCSSLNPKVARTDEGLFCHHMDEDKAIKLSSKDFAKKNPFKYQLANRLVYCNFLEHLILHLKIYLNPEVDSSKIEEERGIGGAINYICPTINDYINGYEFKRKDFVNAFSVIDDLFNNYIYILRWFINQLGKKTTGSLDYFIKKLSKSYCNKTIVELVYQELVVPEVSEQISDADLEQLEIESSSGDLEKTFELGRLYAIGRKVIIDTDKAIQYFLEAANQDHIPSIFELANIFFYGIGIKADYSKAIFYYEKAASLNNIRALIQLGIIYSNYLRTTQKILIASQKVQINNKLDKGKEYFARAAELGSINAYIYLGKTYYENFDDLDSSIKAFEHVVKTVENNNEYTKQLSFARSSLESLKKIKSKKK